MAVRSVAVQSLGKRADLGPAALRSQSTSAMHLVNQLNSLKTPTEFATLQRCGQSGSAVLPASVLKVFVRFLRDQSMLNLLA